MSKLNYYETYTIELLDKPQGVSILKTNLDCLHDFREFVHYLTESIHGTIFYRLYRNYNVSLDLVKTELIQESSFCSKNRIRAKHLPPHPLFMCYKKKRQKTRKQNGLYYL